MAIGETNPSKKFYLCWYSDRKHVVWQSVRSAIQLTDLRMRFFHWLSLLWMFWNENVQYELRTLMMELQLGKESVFLNSVFNSRKFLYDG